MINKSRNCTVSKIMEVHLQLKKITTLIIILFRSEKKHQQLLCIKHGRMMRNEAKEKKRENICRNMRIVVIDEIYLN
jgi:hypothetical protein